MIKSIIKTILIGSTIGLTACTANFDSINTKPYDVTDEDMEADDYKLRAPMLNIQAYVIPNDINLNQFNNCLLAGSFGGYLADSNDGFKQKYSTYNPEDHWIKVPFNDIIPKVYQSYMMLLNSDTKNEMLIAVATVVKVLALLPVTDTYGPIPYSKIGDDAKLTAPYDSEEMIYMEMFKELNEALEYMTLHKTENFNAFADKVYGGKVEKWIKLANSIKLRLAMRISNVKEDVAREMAEEAVNHEIGVLEKNDENAAYSTSRNPFRVVMYEYNGGDSRISADITNYMNGFNDPRRSAYFKESTFGLGEKSSESAKSIKNGYYGLRSGVLVPKGDYRDYSNMNVNGTDKLLWMNAAEVAFLRAEGALRGWNMGGTAQTFYEEGIKLSFEQWGVQGYDSYKEDAKSKVQAYEDPQKFFSAKVAPTNITIKWMGGDFETSLEQIITQKWIANFPLGHEAWAEFRRTGYPKLMPAVDNESGNTVNSDRLARRLMYPDTEYKENTINVNYAVSEYLIGGQDNMGTDLWWAKKN